MIIIIISFKDKDFKAKGLWGRVIIRGYTLKLDTVNNYDTKLS